MVAIADMGGFARDGAVGAEELQAQIQGKDEHKKLTLAATFDPEKGGINPVSLVEWVAQRSKQARLTANGRLIWQPTQKFIDQCEADPAQAVLRFSRELYSLMPEVTN